MRGSDQYDLGKSRTFSATKLSTISWLIGAIFLSGVLAPLAMALFLAVVIQSFANTLERLLGRLLPGGRRFGMPAALLITAVLFIALLVLTIDNASAFASKLVSYAPRLNALIARLAGVVQTAAVPSLDDLLLQLNPGAYLASAAGVVRNLAADTVLILIYLGFILASGRLLERKHAKQPVDLSGASTSLKKKRVNCILKCMKHK